MTHSDESNRVPSASFVADGPDTDAIREATLAVLGLGAADFATAVHRGYAVRSEQGQELDIVSYATGLLDGLSLAATLRAQEQLR